MMCRSNCFPPTCDVSAKLLPTAIQRGSQGRMRSDSWTCFHNDFFLCLPSWVSGLHHSSSSVFPAGCLGFTILLPLSSQLGVWASPFFFFLCLPSWVSGLHHSSSSVFPAGSLGFTILLLPLRSQLYLWCSPHPVALTVFTL